MSFRVNQVTGKLDLTRSNNELNARYLKLDQSTPQTVVGTLQVNGSLAVQTDTYSMLGCALIHNATNYDGLVTLGTSASLTLINKSIGNIAFSTPSVAGLITNATGTNNFGVFCCSGDFGSGTDYITIYFQDSDFADATEAASYMTSLMGSAIACDYFVKSIWTNNGEKADYTWANPDSKSLVAGYTNPPTFTYSLVTSVSASNGITESQNFNVATVGGLGGYFFDEYPVIFAQPALANYFLLNSGNAEATGDNNVGIGNNALASLTTGDWNLAIGANTMSQALDSFGNVAIGKQALGEGTNQYGCIAIGDYAVGQGDAPSTCIGIGGYSLRYNSGVNNIAIGSQTGHTGTTNSNCVFIGHGAAYYETESNKLFIDNSQRGSEPDARDKSLIYGIFDADTKNQKLYFNCDVHVKGAVIDGVETVNDTYTTQSDDSTIVCDKATDFTVNLTQSTVGHKLIIKNINTGVVTLDGSGTETIDGESSQLIYQWDSMQIQCYAANKWVIL